MVTIFDMGRQFDQRTAASVFGITRGRAASTSASSVSYLFAANLDYFIDKETLLKDVQQQLGAQGMRAGDVRQIKFRHPGSLQRLLLLISTVAFAAMAVASLGVTNTSWPPSAAGDGSSASCAASA